MNHDMILYIRQNFIHKKWISNDCYDHAYKCHIQQKRIISTENQEEVAMRFAMA